MQTLAQLLPLTTAKGGANQLTTTSTMINLTERGIDLYYDLIASANQGINYWQAKKDEGWQSIYQNIDVSRELRLNTTDLYRFIAQLTACED